MVYKVLLCKSTSVLMGERQMLAAIVKKREKGIRGFKSAFVDKTPLSLYWPEKKFFCYDCCCSASLLFSASMLFSSVDDLEMLFWSPS